ncbi:MAG: hypothetical protein K0Q74_124 [Gammaproteobacteria bacterium]|nr:hypothetical protein [Gammaproteobacteria bacterium]
MSKHEGVSPPEISLVVFISGALLLCLLSAAFFVEQMLHQPPCCDVLYYLDIARSYNEKGMFQVKEGIRTFGYPWILSLITKFSHSLLFDYAFVWIFQSICYVFTCYFVAHSIAQFNVKLAKYIYLALCTNVFISPYLGVPLTDALHTMLALSVLVGLMSTDTLASASHKQLFWRLFFIIFLISFSIILRPAAIWLLLPGCYFIAHAFIQQRKLLIFLSALLLGTIPLFIQIALNKLHYNVISFFPIIDLGHQQIIWGIENIKFGAWFGGDRPPENFYPSSPIIDSAGASIGIAWYFLHPIDAIKLITLKFFAAFDWEYIMPYPRATQSRFFMIVPSLLSFSIMWWGLVGTVIHTFRHRLSVLGLRFMPLLALLSWGGVTLLSALELRFTLPILTYFIIVGMAAIYYIASIKSRTQLTLLMLGQVLFVAIAMWLSTIIRGQAAIQW